MAVHRSFGHQIQYHSTCSILYGWEINNLSCKHKYFTPATMQFVLRKKANTTSLPTPQPRSVIRHNFTNSISQCAPISQKYAQAVRFRVPSEMRKKFLWMYRSLRSTALTPGIVQIWRLIFVLERSILRIGKRIEVCIT